MSLPELLAWRVEALRLTVFFSEPVNAQNRNWGKSFTGGDPESIVSKPQTGEYTEQGSFHDGQFELKVAFNRVDWSVSFPFSELPNAPKPAEISKMLDDWLVGVSGWLAVLEMKPIRLALGLVAHAPVENVVEANEVISSYFPFVSLAADSNYIDASVQVNSPYPSTVLKGLDVNRVVKFEVATRQIVTIGPAGMPTSQTDTVLRSHLDLNTSPLWKSVFEVESCGPIIHEMKPHVVTLLSKGFAL
ncbi:hypothetical protein [Pseudomonas lactis]|uniref:hypothetical protein n=1 Tax=Pseudomonas lactis TaxID=1615674 RepID=UPI001473A073|nr:hypothetical protein [Pseudomonas lactis]NNA50658.1 hypothetical protein [Pseudomonas lactis]